MCWATEGGRRLTVDEEKLVLVDEVRDAEVQGRKGEDERRDDGVGYAQRPNEQRLKAKRSVKSLVVEDIKRT